MKARLTLALVEGELPRASTILGICKKALEATGRYKAKEEHGGWADGKHRRVVHHLDIVEVEACSICHGEGFTSDHHDPCTECGGSGYYD